MAGASLHASPNEEADPVYRDYRIYYDRRTRIWWAYWIDERGDQLGDAVDGPSRDLALIYLGLNGLPTAEALCTTCHGSP